MADGEIPTAIHPADEKNDTHEVSQASPPTAFHRVSHALLFEEVATESARCDVCNELVEPVDSEGYAVGGSGLYVWTRGDEVRYEEPPLCGRCGTAIGVMALAQWDLEEDEG